MASANDNLRRLANYVKRRVFHRPQDEYARKLENEQAFYADCENVHDLPEIFHYWANKFLLPQHSQFGITNPEQFYFLYAERQCARKQGEHIDIVSIGSGNCDVEAQIAAELLAANHRDFSIECVDINEAMLDRGRNHAGQLGVSANLKFTRADFNRWQPESTYDVVIANQALHHVIELEDLFATIKTHLRPQGLFLTSDMIGRNGHARWPEAMEALRPFWAELPEPYRFNRLMKRYEHELMYHDCSTHGFEGIRAQDILPLLVQNFHFELFLPFANIIFSFIDRPFGHNFDASAQWDRDFIDRVHQRDEEGLRSGELKPTQMMAAMQNEPVETKLVHPRLTPEFCIRWPEDKRRENL